MSYPVFNKYFENSHYYNVGLWDDTTLSQKGACENLVRYLLKNSASEKKTILDVGCGHGSVCRYIKENGWYQEITGINISTEQIDFCKQNIRDIRFEMMDACNMTFEKNSFNTIISIEAALHFPSRKKFLDKAFDILTPGGNIAVCDFLFEKSLKKGMKWMTPDENNISSAEYKILFEKAGFKEITIEDATEKTWKSYLLHLKKWITENFKSNTLSNNEMLSALDIYKKAKEFPVKEFIIIHAKK